MVHSQHLHAHGLHAFLVCHPTTLLHGGRVGASPPVSGAELVPYPTPVTAGLGEANELLDPLGPVEQLAFVLCEGCCLPPSAIR